MEKKEITAVDYDALLKMFCSNDLRMRGMITPKTVGNKTYATDGHGLIIMPTELITGIYEPNEYMPDYNSVLSAIVPCEPERYKDTDLFKALQAHPKEYDTKECCKCDGAGECFHCNAECKGCDGSGEVEDKSKPMVYINNGTIQIGEQYFYPPQMGRLEKVVLELESNEFTIVGRSALAILVKVGAIEVVICRMELNGNSELPNTVLTPIQ